MQLLARRNTPLVHERRGGLVLAQVVHPHVQSLATLYFLTPGPLAVGVREWLSDNLLQGFAFLTEFLQKKVQGFAEQNSLKFLELSTPFLFIQLALPVPWTHSKLGESS